MSEETGDIQKNNAIVRHVEAFEEKVNMCVETFSRNILREMCRDLSKLHGDIDSINKVQKIVSQESMLPGAGNARMMRYFQWFLDNYGYLKELNRNFEIRIYQPLIRFFNVTAKSERSVHSAHSSGSGTRPPSSDSDFTDFGTDSDSEIANEIEVLSQLQASHSRDAILLMSREFTDITSIYDNSDIENIARRLVYLKQRLDFLLEEEGEINSDLFSLDSEPTEKISDEPKSVQNFLRMIPDILVKCQKAAKLAKQWLDADRKKAIDLNAKLETISEIKTKMTEKLSTVDCDIAKHEGELDRQTDELQNLLGREERTNELSIDIHACDLEIGSLTTALNKASQEKKTLAKQLVQLGKNSGDTRKNILVKYKDNRLRIQALKRRMSLQKYRKSLLDDDVGIEMSIKPDIIRLTNDTQDSCEKLEKVIDEELVERQRLQNALAPLNEDIIRVQSQLEKQSICSRMSSTDMTSPAEEYYDLQYGSDLHTPRADSSIEQFSDHIFITENPRETFADKHRVTAKHKKDTITPSETRLTRDRRSYVMANQFSNS